MRLTQLRGIIPHHPRRLLYNFPLQPSDEEEGWKKRNLFSYPKQFKAAPDLSLTLGIRTQRFHVNRISGRMSTVEGSWASWGCFGNGMHRAWKNPPPQHTAAPPGSSGMRCCGSIASLSEDCSPRLTSLSEIYKRIFSGPLISCAVLPLCCKRGARKGTSRRRRRRPDEEKKRKERAEKGKWQRSIMRNARTCARIWDDDDMYASISFQWIAESFSVKW